MQTRLASISPCYTPNHRPLSDFPCPRRGPNDCRGRHAATDTVIDRDDAQEHLATISCVVHEDACNAYALARVTAPCSSTAGAAAWQRPPGSIGVTGSGVGPVRPTTIATNASARIRLAEAAGARLAVPSHERRLFERARRITGRENGSRITTTTAVYLFHHRARDLPVALFARGLRACSLLGDLYTLFILPDARAYAGQYCADRRRRPHACGDATGDLMHAGVQASLSFTRWSMTMATSPEPT